MDKRYVTIGGQRFRVEVNFNTLEDFAAMKKLPITRISDLRLEEGDNLKVMMTAAIREGERLDGRECLLTPMDLGTMLDGTAVEEFSLIFSSHVDPAESPAAGSVAPDTKKKSRRLRGSGA